MLLKTIPAKSSPHFWFCPNYWHSGVPKRAGLPRRLSVSSKLWALKLSLLCDMLALLGALPVLINLLRDIWAYVMKVSNGDPATYFAKLSEGIVAAKTAQTEQEHKDAAKAIANALSRMPK